MSPNVSMRCRVHALMSDTGQGCPLAPRSKPAQHCTGYKPLSHASPVASSRSHSSLAGSGARSSPRQPQAPAPATVSYWQMSQKWLLSTPAWCPPRASLSQCLQELPGCAGPSFANVSLPFLPALATGNCLRDHTRSPDSSACAHKCGQMGQAPMNLYQPRVSAVSSSFMNSLTEKQ